MTPRARGPLTAEQREARNAAIAEAYRKGSTQHEAGAPYDLSSQQVGLILRQLGVPMRERRRPSPIPVGSGATHRDRAVRMCDMCSNDAVSGSQLCTHHNAILDEIAANAEAPRKRSREVAA